MSVETLSQPGFRDLPSPTTYDLSPEETHELTKRFLIDQGIDTDNITDENRFVCMEFEGSEPWSVLSRQPEGVVFEKKFGNSAQAMAQEYGPYEEASLFYTVFDLKEQVPAGTIRMIRNSPAGLKTLNDLASEKVMGAGNTISVQEVMDFHGIESLDDCLDGGTAAVGDIYTYVGRGQVHMLLERAWFVQAENNFQNPEIDGPKHLVSAMDKGILNILRNRVGLPLVPLGQEDTPESRDAYSEYLGSEQTQLVYGYMPHFREGAEVKWVQAQDSKNKLTKKVLDILVGGDADDKLLF